jgi:hypothetical protein
MPIEEKVTRGTGFLTIMFHTVHLNPSAQFS